MVEISDKEYKKLQARVKELEAKDTERKRAEKEIRESEEKFKLLFENSKDGIVAVNNKGEFEIANEVAVKNLGYTMEEFLKLNIEDVEAKESKEEFEKHYADMLEGKRLLFNTTHRKKDGSLMDVEVSLNLIDLKGKRITYSVWCDITERKRAERELRESKEFSESLIDSMRDGFSALDTKGVHINVNPAFCKMTGFKKEELIGVGAPHPYWPEEELGNIQKSFKKTLSEDFADVELIFKRKNGERFPVIVSPAQAKDVSGKVVTYFATVKDISSRKRAEEEVKALSSVVKQSTEGMAIAGLDGKLTFVNDAWCKMHGYHDSKKLLGNSLAIFHNKEQLENDVKPFNEKVKKLGAYSGEVGHITRGGKPFPTFMSTSLLKDEQGKPYALAGIATDISSRKQLEERFKSVALKSPIPTAVGGADGSIMLFNEALGKMIGYSRSEIKNTFDWANKLYPDKNYRDFVQKNIEQALAGKEQECSEFTITCKDGSKKLVVFYTSFFEGGLVIQMIDITERKRAEEGIKESEERYRLVVDNAAEGILSLDLNGNILQANVKALQISGFKREELLGKNFVQVLPGIKLDVKTLLASFRNIISGRELEKKEWAFTNKQGKQIVIRAHHSPIKKEGKTIGLSVIIEDITERKRAEETLRQSEKNCRDLFNNATDAIYIQDKKGCFLDVNQGATDMYGYPREFFIGKTPEFLSAPGKNDMKMILGFVEDAFNGKPRQYDFWGLRKNGEVFPKIVRSQKGLFQGQDVIITFATDITERKRVEEALKISEEKWKSLVENAPDVIMEVSRDGKIQKINRTVPGLSVEQVVGKNVADFMPPDQKGNAMAAIEKVFKTGESTAYEVVGVGPQGSTAYYSTRIGPIKRGGKVDSTLHVTRDITERKQAEEALKISSLATETSMNAIFMADINGAVTYANNAAAKMWGYKSSKEMIGTNALEYWTKSTQGVAREMIGILLKVGHCGTSGKLIGKRLDGAEFSVESNSVIVKDKDGKPAGMIGSFSDITDRKKAEEEKDKLAKFMTGREGRVIELKEEVNALLKEMGKEGKYRQ